MLEEDIKKGEGYQKLKFIPKDKKLFLGIICGVKGSEVELIEGGFVNDHKQVSSVVYIKACLIINFPTINHNNSSGKKLTNSILI